MQVEKTNAYLSTRKKIIKKRKLTLEQIEFAEYLLEKNYKDSSLDFKNIVCKKDKYRRSVKISNTQYRILLSHRDNMFILVCICDHDDYQIKNKNC